MILSDFGGPGAHFSWFLSILGAWEALLEAWGHILSPRLGFLWFWRLYPPESLVPFWLLFWYFLDSIVSVFSSARLFWFFVILGAQSIQNGRHLEVILRSFLGTGDFLIFDTPPIRKPIFWGREGTQNCIILGDFFEDALREASGTRFLMILSDFGLSVGAHLAPKRHQKMRPQKWWKKGKLVADLGPL